MSSGASVIRCGFVSSVLVLSWHGHSDMVVMHWRSHDCSGLAWLDYSSVWWTARDSSVSGELGGQDDSSIHHTMQGRRAEGIRGAVVVVLGIQTRDMLGQSTVT